MIEVEKNYKTSKNEARIIHYTLKMASRQFSALGGVRKWSLNTAEDIFGLFSIEHEYLDGQHKKELIVLPLDKVNDVNIVIDIRKELERDRLYDDVKYDIYYIDCFSVGMLHGWKKPNDSEREDVKIISSEELWERLTGLSEYYNVLSQSDNEVNRVRQEFIPRTMIAMPGANSYNEQMPRDEMNAISTLSDWANSDSSKRSNGMVITSERGTGKTWILKKFIEEQTAKHSKAVWRYPAAIYISLKDYSKFLQERQGIRKTICCFIYENNHISGLGGTQILESFISSGRIILLLDGIDELAKEVTNAGFEEILKELLNNLPPSARTILTTRATKFKSNNVLIESLSLNIDKPFKTPGYDDEYLIDPYEKYYRPSFELYLLKNFSPVDIPRLFQIVKDASFRYSDMLVDLLSTSNIVELLSQLMPKTEHDDFIVKSIMEISQIPACARSMAKYLIEFSKNKDNQITLLRLYESILLDPLIAFNLEADRAISEIQILRAGENGEKQNLFMIVDIRSRLNVIQHTAQFLMEQGQKSFDFEVLTDILAETYGLPFEYVSNDLRTNSVFLFNENQKLPSLSFRTNSILSYFTARQIFTKLANPSNRYEGLKLLGRYQLAIPSETNNSNPSVLKFMRSFLNEGMIDFEEGIIEFLGPTDADHSYLRVDKNDLIQDTLRFIESVNPFSVWIKHLSKNLSFLDIDYTLHPELDGWADLPDDIVSSSEILLASNEPYILMEHEVTNKEYYDFLGNEKIPFFDSHPDGFGKLIVKFKNRKIENVENAVKTHPLSWEGIHPLSSTKRDFNIIAVKDSNSLNHFENFTNAYHLFEFPEGKIPNEKFNHPVVWLSFYVVAIYCNWKTIMDIDENECAYEIGIDKDNKPFLIYQKEKKGFRLPTVEEWKFAARGGDEGKNPWENKLNSEDEKIHREGELLREFLTRQAAYTQDVRKYNANDYGIFGMIGNVREWAQKKKEQITNEVQVMGATWMLGDESFEYDFDGISIPLCNTNMDVGFRIARAVPKYLRDLIVKKNETKISFLKNKKQKEYKR